MAALGLLLLLTALVCHWLLEPLVDLLTGLFNLTLLPWLPPLLLAWLLAAGAPPRGGTSRRGRGAAGLLMRMDPTIPLCPSRRCNVVQRP